MQKRFHTDATHRRTHTVFISAQRMRGSLAVIWCNNLHVHQASVLRCCARPLRAALTFRNGIDISAWVTRTEPVFNSCPL